MLDIGSICFPGKKLQWHIWMERDGWTVERLICYVVNWADLHADYQGGP